jgi:hypothetical protein
MPTNEIVDNDDGISIIDITDLVSPRYCMVFFSHRADEQYVLRPLSAKEYVEHYYPFINPEKKAESDPHDGGEEEAASIRTAYEGLLGIPLIDMATLAETWPDEYGKSRRQDPWKNVYHPLDEDSSDPESINMVDGDPLDGDGSDPESINVVDGAKTIEEGPSDEENKEKIPSLATMAIFKAVHAILQDEDNADQIDFLLRFPMIQESINAVITSLAAESQLPDYILPVLAKVLIPLPIDGYMDLSQFALSGNQICQLAKMIPSCKILKLGGQIDAEIDDIVNAIKCLPELDTVMLFDDLVSIGQLAYLRRELPSDRIRIAHRGEYFHAAQFISLDGLQYTRPNVPDFLFIVDERNERDINDASQICGVGVEVLDDPNFIIQTVRDFLRVQYRIDAATIAFATNKRTYGVPFDSSAFVSIVSPQATLERENPDRVQWGFVCHNTDDRRRVLKYGFFRYQHGSPLQVMDVDGFVTALSKERPDLPPVASGSAQPGVQFTSFLDEVRYILGAKSEDQTGGEFLFRWPTVFLSVEEAEEIILRL